MSQPANTNTDCRLLGEFTDVGEVAEEFAHLRDRGPSNSQVERPRVTATYLDIASPEEADKEFKILLSDERLVTVRGHFLRFVPNTANPQDCGSYGIVRRAAEVRYW